MQTCTSLTQFGIIPFAFVAMIIAFIGIQTGDYDYVLQKEELLLVQVIFANGEQTSKPQQQQPTKEDSEIYWLNTNSTLSLHGQKSAHKLGRVLKDLYHSYLNSDGFNEQIISSTSGDLNIMQSTLQCVHAGLFPTFPGSQIISIDLDWRPIPYTILYQPNDDILYQKSNIDGLNDLFLNNLNLSTTLECIKKGLNFDVKLKDIVMINDYLKTKLKLIEEVMYYKLFDRNIEEYMEKWEREVYKEKLQELTDEFWLQYGSFNKNAAGKMMHTLLHNIKARINGEMSPRRKINLFSGQRLNIAAFLSALDVWDEIYSQMGEIHPCSYILIELLQDIQTNYYKIYFYFHNGQNLKTAPLLIKPRFCLNQSCTVFEFTELVNELYNN